MRISEQLDCSAETLRQALMAVGVQKQTGERGRGSYLAHRSRWAEGYCCCCHSGLGHVNLSSPTLTALIWLQAGLTDRPRRFRRPSRS